MACLNPPGPVCLPACLPACLLLTPSCCRPCFHSHLVYNWHNHMKNKENHQEGKQLKLLLTQSCCRPCFHNHLAYNMA
jgi:hypothetical protein